MFCVTSSETHLRKLPKYLLDVMAHLHYFFSACLIGSYICHSILKHVNKYAFELGPFFLLIGHCKILTNCTFQNMRKMQGVHPHRQLRQGL